MADHRFLIVTASMGAGHDQTAAELARRFEADGAETRMVDLLDVLPRPIGPALERGYSAMLRRAPWLYELIYRGFMQPREHLQAKTSPLAMLAARRLRPAIDEFEPDCVVSTFHLAGQAVGRLRGDGRLHAPSVVVVTEVVPHAMWLDPNADLFCCLYPSIAQAATKRTGKEAIAPGPVVEERFRTPRRAEAGRATLGLRDDEDMVLVSTGSWGVGDPIDVVRALAGIERVRPIVLCGANSDLQGRVAAVPGAVALGWRDDVPDLLAAAAVTIDNAGGSMCMEAFASGVPVVGYRPIPGHGGPVVRAMADEGLIWFAHDDAELVTAVDALRTAGPDRDRRIARARSIFVEDPAAAIVTWLNAR